MSIITAGSPRLALYAERARRIGAISESIMREGAAPRTALEITAAMRYRAALHWIIGYIGDDDNLELRTIKRMAEKVLAE